MSIRFLPVLYLLLLSQALLAQHSAPAKMDGVPETCPVTEPYNASLFVPPAPYPRKAPLGAFWFGTDKLWTILRMDATWPRSEKTFWWRQDWSGYKSGVPESAATKLAVTARRLDISAAPPRISKGLGGYKEEWKSFLVGGIDFPTFGCWEISAHYEDDELNFVVWVAN